ncbi:YutD family protein [Tuanshanicoccus lijuaniae]|nr:YutD family protein [Aerococcaceae bacterium zg-1292]MBF6624991.1 YutD family protein [Aerococcaceae bacterium zg-BR9]MBF6626258.1 YutD family protein [Aerococcaceae bacterium zg-BR9]MBF6978108.1 YutD family protein [Aerococcaceae bacterium zg-BR22]QQA37599.1 YutD family protein [Aerococcaceae bacterium zg-1292]
MKHRPVDTITTQIESILTSITTEGTESEKSVYLIDETTVQIKQQVYRVVKDYREGFDYVAFEARYQEYFDKFDFIVGDWGYDQLRLRGFYQLNRRKVPREQTIDYLEDYLKEYCNFGCKYFVLAKEEALLKYNQLTQAPSRSMKQSVKPTQKQIHTRNVKEQQEIVPPVKVKTAKKVKQRDNFQIKQSKRPKVKSVQPTKQADTKTSVVAQTNKRKFVIKEHQSK